MSSISQEFYCHECNGYFLVRLNMAINHEAEIICPNCGHEHRRCIIDGQIFEKGRNSTAVKEKIRTTKVNYSKTPFTQKMREAHENSSFHGRRDGVPMFDQWLNVAARERGEI
jgi:predicted RNA-binding Zn-ribbon protein involved in translation (DUF1610 family)